MADVEAIDNVFNEYIRGLYRETEQAIVQITDPDTIPKEVQLIRVSCIRCHHSWYIRRNKFPKVCASCTSRYWNSPTKRELGFEYFGKRIYAYCRRCGTWLSSNSKRIRKNGDIVKIFACPNCGFKSSLNISTNERDVRPKKRRGKPTLHDRIILVEIPSVVTKFAPR